MPMTVPSLAGRIETKLAGAQAAGPMDLTALSTALAQAVIDEIHQNAQVTVSGSTASTCTAGGNVGTFNGGGTIA